MEFKCHCCDYGSRNMKHVLTHQKSHRMDAKFSFRCPVPTCHITFKTFNAADLHLSRAHQTQESAAGQGTSQQVGQVFPCEIEGCTQTLESIPKLCHHFIDHLKAGEGPLKCPLKCVVKFGKDVRTPSFSAGDVFRTHLSVKHIGWRCFVPIVPQVQAQREESIQFENSNEMDVDIDIDTVGQDTAMDIDSDSDDLFSFDSLVQNVGKFYLMLEGQLFLPETTVQTICDQLKFLSETVQIKMRQALEKELTAINCPEAKADQIVSRVLAADPLFASHHTHSQGPTLTSDDRRRSYYKDNFGLVPVVEFNAAPRSLKPKLYHYVPVEETLKTILKDPSVQKDIEESFTAARSSNNVIANYRDGSLHVNDPPKTLDLMIFMDAFNPANPLGAVKNLYKVVGVYMTILNLKTEHRTRLDAIHLIMLAREKFLEECNLKGKKHRDCQISCSHEACFQRLIRDLNKLYEQGVTFGGQKIPVRLKFVVGDSLGAHQVGGMNTSFSKSKYFCRYCDVTRAQFNADPHRCVGQERTPEHFQAAVQRLKFIRLNRRMASHKGIKFDSVLNKIKGFHVGTPGLPPCLGHDIFHGVATWDLGFIINYFIKTKGYFTMSQFIERLKQFKCEGYDCGNKPQSIKKECAKGLGVNAVHVWFMVRNLSLLIGDLVKDKNDNVWKLYLRLKKMCEFACAPRLSKDQVQQMGSSIKRYLKLRWQMGLKFKPKHHFLLHYVDIFLKHGPLIFLWAMRFESMHGVFKRIALNCRNYINITSTMASKYQLYLTHQSTGSRFSNDTEVAPKSELVKNYQFDDQETKILVETHFSSTALVSKAVSVNLVKFQEGNWLLQKDNATNNLSIGKIMCTVVDGQDVRIVIEPHSVIFHDDLRLYQIGPKAGVQQSISAQTCLEARQPVYSFQDDLFFSLKYTQLE